MTKQLEALIVRLNERYGPTEVPKCRICSGNLSLQRSGAGVDVWACSGQINDGDGWRYAPGRDIADTHYQESRWHDYSGGGDADVIELIAALEREVSMREQNLSIKLHMSERIAELESTLELEREKSRRVMSQNHQLEASPLAVKLPPRKTAADYVDDVFTNEDLAAIYNVTRLECSVRIKNAGGTVEGE